MMNHLIDRIGNWNPQLLREIKGRLKVFPALIAFAISLVVQSIVFLARLQEIPDEKYSAYGQYCKLGLTYGTSSDNEVCPLDKIDMQMWWHHYWSYIFITLSAISVFTLLVAGTYLLINNLATEERRGTLNFIRLSPQPEGNILIGKIIGVPILIYLVVLAAIPLQLFAGYAANIATTHILSFWATLVACCICFYSAALLFGLSCRWFNGFQPWLGSGAVLLFLIIALSSASSSIYTVETAWLRMFSPFEVMSHLFFKSESSYYNNPLNQLQFFSWQVGKSFIGVVGLHLLNYGLCTYWFWQGLTRCFRNPHSTIFSKSQSYLLIACLQIVNLGFYIGGSQPKYTSNIQSTLAWVHFLNLFVLLSLIVILSPHRQTIQDWARYRHEYASDSNRFKKKSLWEDLIHGEKSPAILAIALNLFVIATPFIVGIPLWNLELPNLGDKIKALLAVALFMSLIMIYATLAQLLLLMKTDKRAFWAIGTTASVMFLLPLLLGILTVGTQRAGILWLFTSYSWVGIQNATILTISLVLLVQLTILTLLIFQLIAKVKLAGESATQALLAER